MRGDWGLREFALVAGDDAFRVGLTSGLNDYGVFKVR